MELSFHIYIYIYIYICVHVLSVCVCMCMIVCMIRCVHSNFLLVLCIGLSLYSTFEWLLLLRMLYEIFIIIIIMLYKNTQLISFLFSIQAPINDDKACTSLVGISPHTSKVHILRAILESLAFRFKLLYDAVHRETKINLSDVIRYCLFLLIVK